MELWTCPECSTVIAERNRRGPHLSACRRSKRARGEPVEFSAVTGPIATLMKFCSLCNELKPNTAEFWYKDQGSCIACFRNKNNERYRTDSEYRESAITRSHDFYHGNKEANRATQHEWYLAHQTQQKAYNRLRKFGITQEQYDAMLESQNYGCAICGEVEQSGNDLAVDHDHRCCPGKQSCGKCVRGLLCMACNHALGKLRDNSDLLRKGAEYLENYN